MTFGCATDSAWPVARRIVHLGPRACSLGVVQTGSDDGTIGAVFDGRYRIEALLGRGGMGAVYRAHQLAVGRDVAVKVLHPALSADAATVERFENEARAIASLRHPNTIKLVDVGRLTDGRIFIVTELVEGKTLEDLLDDGLPLPEAIAILLQVCDALNEAHQQGVVHRDLKPGNVMVERIGSQDVAKVLDFGIAKLAAQPKVTATGAIFGTPAYMSPEQAKGVAVDARTDVYALGVMLYQLATGRLPFESTSPGALMVRHISEEPQPPSDLLDGIERRISPMLEDLILQMLEKDPDDRPETMEEVRRRLSDPKLLAEPEPEPALAPPAVPSRDEQDTAPPAPPPGPSEFRDPTLGTPRAPPSRRAGLWLAGTALALALGGWWAWGLRDSGPRIDSEPLPRSEDGPASPVPLGSEASTPSAPDRQAIRELEDADSQAPPRGDGPSEPQPGRSERPGNREAPKPAAKAPASEAPAAAERELRSAERGRFRSPEARAPAQTRSPEPADRKGPAPAETRAADPIPAESEPTTAVPPGLQDVEL